MEEVIKETEGSEQDSVRSEENVTITISDGSETVTKTLVFNTPDMLEAVKTAKAGSKVQITVKDMADSDPRVLIDDTTEKVIEALSRSIVPSKKVGPELKKFARFLLDHSRMKAIAIQAVCIDDEGQDAGFGFAATAHDCTVAQAVSLVNCGDANMDEFVNKAKLDIPGRGGVPEKGTVVTPTPEQVERLG